MAEKKKNVVLTNEMLDSLEECLVFLLEDLKVSVEIVLATQEKILEATKSLEYQPLRGCKEPYLEHLNQNHRRIIVGHYKIIYLVDDENVYVVKVFDSRKDPAKMKG